jgi:hypothetical protein
VGDAVPLPQVGVLAVKESDKASADIAESDQAKIEGADRNRSSAGFQRLRVF